jgi:hypothetical protein
MKSISFSHPTRQLFLVPMFVFTIGSTWGQSNPYQPECAKFEGNPAFQCAPYSNCRLMGGSIDECVIKAESRHKKSVTSIKEVMDKEASDKAAREKWISDDRQRRQQQDWQQQQLQQEIQRQYQQNKK